MRTLLLRVEHRVLDLSSFSREKVLAKNHRRRCAVSVRTIVVILVVIHRTECLDHLVIPSAVMIAIGCATVAVIPANHPTDQGRAIHTGAKVEFLL